MRALRTGIVALIVLGLATSAFAGDLHESIAKAAQTQQPERAPSKSTSKPLVWAGAALFVAGMAVGLTAFINNENGEFAEFGEANAVNKELGTIGLATAFGGGVLMFLGSRPSNLAIGDGRHRPGERVKKGFLVKLGDPMPMLKRISCCLCVMFAALSAPPAFAGPAQPPPSAPAQPTPAVVEEKPDEGIPVTSDLVKRKCGSCHRADEKGRLTRISYRRTTPEGWEQTIKRMITLNNLAFEPAEARDVLRYLSDRHGLAPEEAKPAAFEVERRQIEYTYADKDTNELCTTCHSMGRVIWQRRTKAEWTLLLNMHRAIYPGTDTVFRRSAGRRQQTPQPGAPPPDNRHPMDKAIEHLSSAFPLTSAEWAAWSATMRPPQLAGRWALAGYQPGRGPVFGQVVVTQGDPNSGEFTTETTFTYARGGQTVTRRGRGLVYTGFQWRGRSSGEGTSFPVPNVSTDWREVLSVDRDWRRAEGRWFTGAYNELGLDVRLHRVGADPVVLGTAESMIKTGASRQELHLFGANLPSTASPADVNFGPGITVDRIVSATPTQMVVSVSVAPTATLGRRSVMVAGATGDASVAVYDTVDFLKVTAAVRDRAPRGRGRVPEATSAVRGDRLREGTGRQAGHERRRGARSCRRTVDHRGVHRHLQRRRQGFRRRD